MKQSSKSFTFIDFKDKLNINKIFKNELKISSISNLTIQNNVIEPLSGFEDFFLKIFNGEDYIDFKYNNENFINTIIFIYTYDYFDAETSSYKSRIFVVNNTFSLFELNIETKNFQSLQITFNKLPTFLTFNNKLYIFSSNDNLLLFEQSNELPLTILSLPKITKILDYNHQYFFLVNNDKNYLYIASDNFEIEDLPTMYNEYEKVKINSMYGEIIDIVVYKNYIYIVQQYGIAKFSIVSNIYRLQYSCAINSKIIKNTIQTIDDYLIFLTTSGLYIFDGNDTKEIFHEFTKLIKCDEFKSLSYNNNYYLLTKMLIDDILETVILEFNIEKENCNIYNIGQVNDIYLLKTINNYSLLALTSNNNKYKILRLAKNKLIDKHKIIRFNKFIINDYEKKTIKKFKISGIGNYNITLTSDLDEYYLSINGSKSFENLGFTGHVFELTIESDESFMINSIYILTSTIED